MSFQSDAFITDYYARCCAHAGLIETELAKKSQHIFASHLQAVFEEFIQPAFTHKNNPQLRKGGHYIDPWIDQDLEETPPWNVVTRGYKPVDVLAWAVETSPRNSPQEFLPKVIPPILILIDYFDIKHKHQGVLILHSLIRKLDDTLITVSGLENVFIEALFRCLVYLVTEDDLSLVSCSYLCLMDLISKTKKSQSKERVIAFEKVLVDGVIKGLSYSAHRINCLSVLVQPIERIYREIGSVGVRYLKVVLPVLCELLSIRPSSFMENQNIAVQRNIMAVRTLNTVMEECWPRVPYYKGMILSALAGAWLHYYRADHENELCPLLKETCQHLREACQDQANADFMALIELNEIFRSLIEQEQDLSSHS